MIRLLRWLIWGDAHTHKWVLFTTTNVMTEGSTIPDAIIHEYHCSVCGKHKMVKVCGHSWFH